LQVKEHFGDPMIEQRKLSEGDAVCLLDTQGVIAVSGIDRLTWLHSLLSQNLKNLAPGESAEALLLDPQGRIEQVIKVIDDGETTWLMVDRSHAEALLSWLQKMVFRMKVEITDRSAQFATVGATKASSELSFVSNAHPVIWKDQWPGVVAGGYRY
jgi:folate-binding Fe-S cluster repair protein YgfZ